MSFLSSLATTATQSLSGVPGLLAVLTACTVASAAGALAAVAALDSRQQRTEDLALLSSINISIAYLVALLGRLLNVKRSQVVSSAEDALIAAAMLEDDAAEHPALDLSPWVDYDYRLRLPDHEIFARAGRQLDVVQLLALLDVSLADLSHLVRQRNAMIAQLDHENTEHGAYDRVSLRRYIALCRDIARITDENLFFIDKAIQKLRSLAHKTLPNSLHSRVADVGLRPETGPLMPPADLIKTFE